MGLFSCPVCDGGITCKCEDCLTSWLNAHPSLVAGGLVILVFLGAVISAW